MLNSDPGSLELQLIRIEVKLDQALTQMADHEVRIRALESHNTQDHSARLDVLERWRSAMPTTALVVSALAVAGSIMTLFLR
ncbi:hypothetical protein AABB02_33395 [Streptomyces rimosus]|uniref:hypothetical protein n=1 Tax=Streptomyces rimosus TaxID=1927 RepID=UPI0031DA73CF